MKKYDLLDAIGNADDEFVKGTKEKKKPNKRLWATLGSVAACLVVVICAVIIIPNINGKIISNYGTSDSEDCYPEPLAGQVIYSTQVTEAREKYQGKNVTYILKFNIYKTGGTLTDEEKNAEYERLISLGYELYTVEKWAYQGYGEKYYFDVVVGRFTEEQLKSFAVNSEYGYLFDFVTNGDGSPISFDEKNIITDFNTNHS